MSTPEPSLLDPRLADIQQTLSSVSLASPPPDREIGDRKHAAVSLILRGDSELEALLIRRAEAEGDPWSGHMALPGGRREKGDPSLLHTAMRETHEETGLDLEAAGRKLGRLEPLEPNTFKLPPISIFPFLFGVGKGTQARVASPEIVEVLWVPLTYLSSPEASGTVRIPLGEITRKFPCLRVGERVIWGLTYRILQSFFQLLREGRQR